MSSIELPDGTILSYRLQTSERARCLRLKLSARSGLTVIVPAGADSQRVHALVVSRAPWIERHWRRLAEQPSLDRSIRWFRPQTLALSALAESWNIVYRETRATVTAATRERSGQILVYGRVVEPVVCQDALRRWLARHARLHLLPWLDQIAAQTGLRYVRAVIKGQQTRWGSCSTAGVINLNYRLLFLPPELVGYVLLHELCHTVEFNHSARFWALMQSHEPQWAARRAALRDAGNRIPAWVVVQPKE